MCVHVYVYLKSDVVIVHASKERLKPLNVPSLCLLCNGLQNTLMTAKKRVHIKQTVNNNT